MGRTMLDRRTVVAGILITSLSIAAWYSTTSLRLGVFGSRRSIGTCTWFDSRSSDNSAAASQIHAIEAPGYYDLCRIAMDDKLMDLAQFQFMLNIMWLGVYYFDIDFGYEGNQEREVASKYAGEAFNSCDSNLDKRKHDGGLTTVFNITIQKGDRPISIPLPLFGPQRTYAFGDSAFYRNLLTVQLTRGAHIVKFNKVILDRRTASARATIVVRPSRHSLMGY
jgi:hypothetical protein